MAQRRLVHAAWLLLLAHAECVNVALMCVSSPLTTTKVAIIESLLHTSPYRVILAFDVHNTVAREIQAAFPPPRAYDLLPLSYLKLAKKFGNKIDNFGGSRMHNPARLGALYWFSVSEYSLMWMFEDDTWSPDYGKFMAPYDQGDNQTEKWRRPPTLLRTRNCAGQLCLCGSGKAGASVTLTTACCARAGVAS